MDVGCTKHFAPLITHDQANKRYQVNAQKVTTFNVNMLRSLKKQNKKEPLMSLPIASPGEEVQGVGGGAEDRGWTTGGDRLVATG